MDIKKRIQELTLDQKAKLYFMGLVRKGVIDTLPEDPKAAYIRDMMDKEDPKMDPEIRSDFDDPIFENLTEIAVELGYLKENMPKEVSDYEMLRSFQKDELLDDLGDIIAKYVKDPDDVDRELDRFDDGGFDNMSNMVTANLLRDPEYKAWAKKFYLNEEETYQNLPKPDRINISYTDPGFRFYGMYLHKDGKRFAKINYEDRATKYLKNLGVKTEVPRSYDTNTLDKIKQEIDALGIKGDYDAAMDVS
jgi:hypothetical protein